ncbi:hypothetical protein [Mannheimia indoligenes]|uniref:hypothetical protein n=1 Tax=Mannheimia indoligenes TaxID=3103145 RepID=UPI002FE58903
MKMNSKSEKESLFNSLLGSFGEFLCYGKEEDIKMWFSPEPKYKAFRFAFGQYLKKGAFYQKVDFFEYCQALSPNIADGILKEARTLGVFPEYKKLKAQKHRIKKGCGGPLTGSVFSYDYDEEEK